MSGKTSSFAELSGAAGTPSGSPSGQVAGRQELGVLDARILTRLADEDVMREVAGGDQEAFAELYDRYVDRVYGLVRRVVRDPSQCEEVAQEVFVEAWSKARSYDPGKGAVASWLLTMAHRRAIDRVRSEQAARDREGCVSDRQVTRRFDEAAEHVETDLLLESVRAALSELSDLQREAIELGYFGGNTYRETAETLGAAPGTVTSALRDGLLRLRDAWT